MKDALPFHKIEVDVLTALFVCCRPKLTLDRCFCILLPFSYIQTIVGSMFSQLFLVFVHPNHRWIGIFSALPCFRTSKPPLDRHFLGFLLFSCIQTIVGSTFSRTSLVFVHPNRGWIDVFSALPCFRASKPRLDRHFLGLPLFSCIQTIVGSAFSQLSLVFVHPNHDWMNVFKALFRFQMHTLTLHPQLIERNMVLRIFIQRISSS